MNLNSALSSFVRVTIQWVSKARNLDGEGYIDEDAAGNKGTPVNISNVTKTNPDPKILLLEGKSPANFESWNLHIPGNYDIRHKDEITLDSKLFYVVESKYRENGNFTKLRVERYTGETIVQS